MSNLSENRVNITMTPIQINTIKTALNAIAANMPFLLGLTPEERKTLPRINVSNKAFTEDAINAVSNNPSLLPAFVNVAAMQNDLTLFTQLDEIATMARSLTSKIEDTQALAGSEAYVSALAAYRMLGFAADAGVAGVEPLYQQLRDRFRTQGSNGADHVDADVPQPA